MCWVPQCIKLEHECSTVAVTDCKLPGWGGRLLCQHTGAITGKLTTACCTVQQRYTHLTRKAEFARQRTVLPPWPFQPCTVSCVLMITVPGMVAVPLLARSTCPWFTVRRYTASPPNASENSADRSSMAQHTLFGNREVSKPPIGFFPARSAPLYNWCSSSRRLQIEEQFLTSHQGSTLRCMLITHADFRARALSCLRTREPYYASSPPARSRITKQIVLEMNEGIWARLQLYNAVGCPLSDQ